MNHHPTDTTLNELLDQALDSSTYDQVQSHLEQCADCRTRLEGLRFVFNALTEVTEQPLALDLVPGVLSRLPVRQPQILWRLALAMQSGVALGLLLAISSQLTQFAHTTDWGNLVRIELTKASLTFSGLIQSLSLPRLLLQWPVITIPTLELPVVRLPGFSVPAFSISPASLIALVLAVGLLWLAGNLILLHPRHKRGSKR
jgi:hypothetical protein